MDLFYTGGRHYLVAVDRFSGYLWIFPLQKLDTRAVVQCLEKLMNTFGYPRLVFSDNGPQFRGDFTGFCQDHHIEHRTSSPGNPSSNGLAESAVKSAKYLIEKCLANKEDVEAALLEWRNTPRGGRVQSRPGVLRTPAPDQAPEPHHERVRASALLRRACRNPK